MTDAQDLAQQALAQANQKSQTNDEAEALTALQNVIERNANELDRLLEELKLQRESLHNIFENDDELSDAEGEAAVLTQKVKERKTKLQSSLEVAKIQAAIKDLMERKKEIEEALSHHLVNVYKLTGIAVVDTSAGEREFFVKATLKRSNTPKKN